MKYWFTQINDGESAFQAKEKSVECASKAMCVWELYAGAARAGKVLKLRVSARLPQDKTTQSVVDYAMIWSMVTDRQAYSY